MTSASKNEETNYKKLEPLPGHCHYFVSKKNRYCKMTVGRGKKFCGEHINSTSENDESTLRMPCPLDNSHSCYVKKLHKHLKKCNARVDIYPDYVVKDINRGNTAESFVKHTISSVEEDILIQLIMKLKAADLPFALGTEVHNHPLVEKELASDKFGHSTRKHLLQNSSLLCHLSLMNVLVPQTCFIEFGAGRGQLSYWIGETMAQQNFPCILVPVDRASNRHKFDNKLHYGNLIKICRLRVDIGDLFLQNVPEVISSQSVVAVSKHLCGVATDLALRCLTGGNLSNVSGILMAPCCHHRVEWESYTGQEYFLSMGFTREEFNIISNLASWATCGVSNFNRGATSKSEDRLSGLGLSPQDQENIGRRCKLLLDYGRSYYLQKFGFSCKIVYYTEQSVSPENVCLIASKNKSV